ncbi:HIT domain-containing protein [Candidatus Saccharibacteria bacterium]|nr:HIT domain-containing protein [Candidatus Saccharibacteria bacterium]
MQQPSIFTRIINGEIPCHKVYEDDKVLAFLTINPVADGHTLVVPKNQVDQIWDLETDDYEYIWKTAQKIAKHLRTVMNVDRVGVVVKGFEVPHTHIHLIPVNFHSGVNFDPNPPPASADDDKLAAIAELIRL